VAHSAQLLPRFTGLAVPRKGYVHGSRSQGETLKTARQIAEASIPVAVVADSGHDLSADNPNGFAEAIAKLLAG